ncbi:UDP-N-acetylglucosamine 2-epimerase (non-hydrolyzing) [Tessaracoccus rhinocerotis]|uniref:UDP-N-acetylglucosamine 2-epimerase (Non-hydrolyzing) n=1 Tax=Tessaracoccus rhinocerotis TaxID=1689449 RepID=A0A553JZC0_9ACTN|nr:UDP-N-acetylglucosamine 2-epimerase (non-hydrolyzing) [Tessaracoccus rhinocerotis]TRY17802.1 UDP-N-acetylglucosamine 2-epimerase (non-hydrolyzing) [Tessaracoccus rhinocerotis]
MKIMSVVGARPQFVKLGPIARAAANHSDVEHVIVHTGQHYDPLLSDVFFRDLGIPTPDDHLGVGSGTHGRQTGAMLAHMDEVLEKHQPDWVLAYGDTNSTAAAALAAVKMHIKLAHLESGLRSFNRRMPEEHNRIVTDHLSDLLLAPTDVAVQNLTIEGLGERALMIGDVMTDVCLATRDAVADDPVQLPSGVDPAQPFVLATIHRADNTDDPARLAAILGAMKAAPVPVVLLAHPRLVALATKHGLNLGEGSLVASEPLAYPQMVRAIMASAGVVTDSGGLQKEAFLLDTPTTTIRTETEWVETLENGWNILDPELTQLADVMVRPIPGAQRGEPYGDGHASERAVQALIDHA